MKTRLIASSILVVALFSGLVTGCNKSNAPDSAGQKTPIVAAQHSDIASEWKVGEDYVLLTNYLGNDFNGKLLNNFNVQVSTAPSHPIRK